MGALKSKIPLITESLFTIFFKKIRQIKAPWLKIGIKELSGVWMIAAYAAVAHSVAFVWFAKMQMAWVKVEFCVVFCPLLHLASPYFFYVKQQGTNTRLREAPLVMLGLQSVVLVVSTAKLQQKSSIMKKPIKQGFLCKPFKWDMHDGFSSLNLRSNKKTNKTNP